MTKYDVILLAIGVVMGIAVGFLTGTSYAMSATPEPTPIQCRVISDTLYLDKDSTRLPDGTWCIN